MKLTKGLLLDPTNENRPDGAWAHALNALFNKEVGAVTKEGGATLEYTAPYANSWLLGHGTYQDITILFILSQTGLGPGGTPLYT